MLEPRSVALEISAEKVSYIALKAREYDVKVEPVEPDPGSNPADDGGRGVIEDYADDPTAEELADAIRGLNDDEVVDLVAVVWVGRGDFSGAEFDAARDLARERHAGDTADYLMGMPLLGDYLEEGLAELGLRFDADVESHL